LQLFQSRLDSQINPDHPLCQLAERIDWDRFDDAYRGHDYKGTAVICIPIMV